MAPPEINRAAGGPARPVLCRHCSRSKVSRPRGLCWSCFYTPAVKELYPSASKRGYGTINHNAPLAPVPTTAAPGTPQKLAVLEGRAKSGLAIFHPADARYGGDLRPLAWPHGQVFACADRLAIGRAFSAARRGWAEANCNQDSSCEDS